MKELSIKTDKPNQIVDFTDEVSSRLKISDGVVSIFVTHTTACITTADLDPGTDLDFLDAIEAIAPDLNYRHPHDPSHTNDHIMSSIIGSSITVPVQNSKLVLGTWQRIVLVELDGPRERNIIINQIEVN